MTRAAPVVVVGGDRMGRPASAPRIGVGGQALILALTLSCATLAWADDDYAPMVHCRAVAVDADGWTRNTCPLELEPYAVRTIYVWFDREIPAWTVPILEIQGAAWPIVVNMIRGHAIPGKAMYAKFRVWNPVALEQYVTLHWLIAP